MSLLNPDIPPYLLNGLPRKEAIVLSISPDTIKNGIPVNEVTGEIMPLYYGNNLSASYGVTTGFNNDNRGYSLNDNSYWYLGRNTGVNYIDVDNIVNKLFYGRNFSIEVECELSTPPQTRDGCILFGLSGNPHLNKDKNNVDSLTDCLYVSSWSGYSDQLRIRCGGTSTQNPNYNGIIPDGSVGSDSQINTKMHFVLTIDESNRQIKAYRDYARTYTGSFSKYNYTGFCWLLLNRNGFMNNAIKPYSNMKFYKIRIWNTLLTDQEIYNLRIVNQGTPLYKKLSWIRNGEDADKDTLNRPLKQLVNLIDGRLRWSGTQLNSSQDIYIEVKNYDELSIDSIEVRVNGVTQPRNLYTLRYDEHILQLQITFQQIIQANSYIEVTTY